MAESELRQRRPQADEDDAAPVATSTTRTTAAQVDADDDYSPWVDVLRVLTFLLVASCGLSYIISGGESFTWGFQNKPGFLRAQWWKDKMSMPVHLTLDELLAYDGSDPDKPLYLAINGTVYDVSNGRHMYGPGASYHAFAGHDAARAFVTTCIDEDNNPDLRGVEQMFLPIDDPDTDSQWTSAELAAMRAEELAVARQKAHDALKNWADFFANSKKYHRVGYVKMDKGWLEKQPVKGLCSKAQKGRSKRKARR
ncbi:hypothetical protein HIM_00109 [Hirsutella minnesotensis 3608]|nr:hypothetical protein HIM_00109 [Hirsutella minnesotensis 3608]